MSQFIYPVSIRANSRGGLVAESDVVLPAFGTVEGFVTDATGAPLSAAPVVLANANVLQPRTSSSNETGFFRFERVALGSFVLTYDHPVVAPFEVIVVPAGAVGRITVATPLANVSPALPETGNVFGELRDGAGVVLPPREDTSLSLEGRDHETSSGVYARTSPVDLDFQSYDQVGVPPAR